MSALINIKLADEELERLAQGGSEYGPQLAKLLEQEMERFDEWLTKEMGGQLIKMERTILKTYLYHKIVGRVDNLERTTIPAETKIATITT